MIEIPLTSDVYYTQSTELSGRVYQLEIWFNYRDNAWRLSIFTEDGRPLLVGRKMVSFWPLLRRQHFNPDIPPGELLVIDTEGKEDPGKETLGTRHLLVYGEDWNGAL